MIKQWFSEFVFIPFSICTLMIGLLGLAKDLSKFRKTGAWVYVISLIILFGLSLFKERESRRSSLDYKSQISALSQEIRDEKASHDRYERIAQTSLSSLNEKLTDLKTQVATEQIRKQLFDTQQDLLQTRLDLATTQRALSPPRAEFVFSIFTKSLLAENFANPIKEMTVDEQAGVIKIDVASKNTSSVPAINGEFRIRICSDCSYEAEPTNWQSIAETPQDRSVKFNIIGSHVVFQPVTLFIRSPVRCVRHNLEVAFYYECQNCKVEHEPQKIRITVNPEQPCIRLVPR